MKNLKALTFVIVVVVLVVFRVVFVNNQSTPEELKKAYFEAVEKVKTIKNPTSDYAWSIGIWNGSIYYSQCAEYSFHKRKEHSESATFSLSKDSTKIILCTQESAFYEEGSWMTFGNAYKKYREFKNASDFTGEIESLIKKRLKKNSEKRLDLTNHYPYVSCQNMKLWFHDDSKKYKYSE